LTNYQTVNSPEDNAIVDSSGNIFLLQRFSLEDWFNIATAYETILVWLQNVYYVCAVLVLFFPLLIMVITQIYFVYTKIYLWWRNNRKK